MDVLSKPANELRELILSGAISIVDLIDKVYERIMKLESKVNAFITLRSRSNLLKEAENKEKEIKRGTAKGLLFGVPVAVKDNISTEGIRTTCGSKILENYVPPYDATVVKLLKKEGAIIIGKTNMDEFAMGSSTETSYFGPTRNPWDLERVPGGSSGGSAAVLAAGIVPLALGSDTGGSVRCPAAFTATVGLKPTYGLVSRYGLIAYANSLEQIGPMARNVTDVALLLNVISKYDENDGTSIPGSRPDYMYSLSNPYHIKGSLKVGLVVEMMGEGVSDEVRKIILGALDKISGEGIEIEEVSLSSLKYALPAYYIIAMSEASSNLARYDGVRYGFRAKIDGDWNKVYMETRAQGFGLEVKRRIIFDKHGLFDNLKILSDNDLMNLIAESIASKYRDKKIDKILTAATDGIPLAIHIGNELGVDVVYAKKKREVGVEKFYEVNYVSSSSGSVMTLYLPHWAIKKGENILIVDDVVRSGETQKALLEMCKQANTTPVGMFFLISVGSVIDRIKEEYKIPVDAMIHL